MKLFIGLISGTSMDGIDAALMDLSSHSLIAGMTYPYSKEAQSRLNEVLGDTGLTLKQLSQLNTVLGQEFAKAALALIAKAKVESKSIQGIGSHGQTLCHHPKADIPYTVQLGCAHTIAELTGIPVVADFRTRDLVLGGEGAPFAPLYHQQLFKGRAYPLVIVNIGGIANITYLANEGEVNGYDTGPGNCLMDAWIRNQLGHNYDEEGQWAARGQLIHPLLNVLLADPYFKRKPPKSGAKEYFSLAWLTDHLQPGYAAVDVQTTLLSLTARSVADSINSLPRCPHRLLVCGGGAHNKVLLRELASLLPEINVDSTQVFNIDPDYIEAAMFAWLAEKTMTNTAIDLRQITGAKRPAVLGAIYPGALTKEFSLRSNVQLI